MPMPERLPPYLEKLEITADETGTTATITAHTVLKVGGYAVNGTATFTYTYGTTSTTDLTTWLDSLFV